MVFERMGLSGKTTVANGDTNHVSPENGHQREKSARIGPKITVHLETPVFSVEQGTHDQLIKSGQRYSVLYSQQGQ